MTGKEEKTVKLEVFDPPMCCASGVCGPNVDKKLVQFSAAVEWLRSQGVQVDRFNPRHQYDAFAGNATVAKAVNDHGSNCLPLILLNGEIVSRGDYPSQEELAVRVGLGGAAGKKMPATEEMNVERPAHGAQPAVTAAERPAFFRKPRRKEVVYLAVVAVFYALGVGYAWYHGLSFKALFDYGLLQPPGVTGDAARLTEIDTSLSWNPLQVAWFILVKGAAVLVELFQYWVIGMLIAGALVVFVSWEKVKQKMGYGGVKANLMATTAGAVIPICSCGVVPVLAGMVEAGIPLGPTMAFLVAAPMLNVPTVFMTAGVLGWPMALARIIATFGIAMAVGLTLAAWQRRNRSLRQFLKMKVTPKLSPELQRFAFQIGMKLASAPNGVSTEEIGAQHEREMGLLEEAGLIERNAQGRWQLVVADAEAPQNACFVLPTGDVRRSFGEKARETVRTAYDFFLQLNYYLVLAVLMAGAIKVLIPTPVIVNFVGGESLNSVAVASVVALLAYVCTYVEVPTAVALMAKGMGGGATLAYLLGGPGLSLPSIVMLSGVFTWRVLALYVGVSFVGCVLAGWLYNLFF